MLKRIIVAFISIPLLLFAVLSKFQYGLPLVLLMIIINGLALNEVHYLISLKKIKIDKIYFITCGVLMIISMHLQTYYINNMNYLFNLVFILSIGIYFISLVFQNDYKDVLLTISCFTFGLFYISYLSSYVLLVKNMPEGSYYLLMIVLLIWANDSFAYFGGKFLGKKKLPVKASPNKTYAGVYTGVLFSIGAVFLTCLIFKNHLSITFLQKMAIGIVFGIIVIFSDLLESVLKRSVDIKDSKREFFT